MNIKTVHIKVRRIDSNDPERELTLELDPDISYINLKQKFLDLLGITNTEDKVFKIRNCDGVLVPLTDVLQQDSSEKLFLIDVTNVHQEVPAIKYNSPLHSVYEEAVKNKIRNMESRISRVESFIPQLKWRRQSLLERTTHTLESRVAFLDRRIDELTPPQWHEYMQNTQNMSVTLSMYATELTRLIHNLTSYGGFLLLGLVYLLFLNLRTPE